MSKQTYLKLTNTKQPGTHTLEQQAISISPSGGPTFGICRREKKRFFCDNILGMLFDNETGICYEIEQLIKEKDKANK